MIELVKVEWAGFGVLLEPGEIRLDNRGLVLVIGDNLDTAAASSNGAGKSTLFKAVSWGLYGRTVDGLTTNVVHKAAQAATVDVKFRVGPDTYLVKRSRTRRSGALSLHKRDGGAWRDMSQVKAADTQAAIEHLLGLDWNAFRCCCLFGQGDIGRFANPSVGDAQRKAILTQVLGLDVYERARAGAKELAGALGIELRRLNDRSRELVNERAAVFADLKAKNAERLGINELDKHGADKVAKLRDEIEAKEIELYKLDEDIARLDEDLDAFVLQRDETDDELTRAREAWEKRRAALLSAGLKAKALEDPGPCPTCGAERDAPDHEKHADAVAAEKSARAKMERADRILSQLKRELADDERCVGKTEADLKYNKRLRKDVEAAIDELESEIEEAESELADIDKRLRAVEDDEARLVDELADLDEKLDEVEKQVEGTRSQLDDVDWWKVALGPKGVPAFAIEAVLPVLNAKTNKHLLDLADGDISVEWSATAPKVSGGTKEELTLKLVVEGVEDPMPSGGQKKKVELATELALAEIVREREGSGTNVLFLDEAFEGIDPIGAERICEWLDELAFDSVFVVSHTDEVEERFDALAVVTKRGGKAKLSEET